MGCSQRGDVHFLKGVPGLSCTPFLIDFRGSGEASGDHLRQPLGDFVRPWGHFELRGVTLGVLGITLGAFRVTLGFPLGHFSVWGSLCV